MVFRQGLVGSDVCALCRVQLIAWRRTQAVELNSAGNSWQISPGKATTMFSISNTDSCLQSLSLTDGHLTSSTGNRAGEEVRLSPLVPDWLVEEKLDYCVLGSSILHLDNMQGDRREEQNSIKSNSVG